jgi:hypothetical protein
MFDRRAANQRVQNGSNKHGLVATTNVKQQNCNIPLSGTHFDVGFGPSSGSGMFQSSFCVRFLNSFSQFRLQDSFGDGTFRNIANNLTRESKNNDATTKSRGQQQRGCTLVSSSDRLSAPPTTASFRRFTTSFSTPITLRAVSGTYCATQHNNSNTGSLDTSHLHYHRCATPSTVLSVGWLARTRRFCAAISHEVGCSMTAKHA